MTKKKTTTKAKDVVVVNKQEESVETKNISDDKNNVLEETISKEEGKDTSSEKESLKSKDTASSQNNDFNWAEEQMRAGKLVSLPTWAGFWFKDIATDKTYVLTREGEIVDTPHDQYKAVEEWSEVEATEEQAELLNEFWAKKNEVAAKDFNSLKAVAYNRGRNTSFLKLKTKISIKDLDKRKKLPNDVARTSEFIMDNGFVYDLESNQLTKKQISKF